jgi:putative nucleotidyltransferase with HDIG domain
MFDEVFANAFLAGAPLFDILKSRHFHTQDHCARVARVAWYTGAQLGLNEDQLKCLVRASVLHDVGKIGVSDSILFNDHDLNIFQVEDVQRHSVIGANIVEKLDLPMADKVAELIRWHHEREDGKGYPDGLTSEHIPVGAQIIAVADVFDALTSYRPHRQAYGQEDAIGIIEEGVGTQFNGDVVRAFKIAYRNRK